MSNKNSLICEALELLQEIRAKVQGDVEDSVVDQLDEMTRMLEEACHSRSSQLVVQEALNLLGKAIMVLPAVAKLIELLRD